MCSGEQRVVADSEYLAQTLELVGIDMAQEPEVDYAELHHRMVRAAEEAINTLIEAQRACGESYIREGKNDAVIKLKDRKIT